MKQVLNESNFSESVAVVSPMYDVFNSTANDSDKSFVVPGNEQWQINGGLITLVTTATVGNRLLVMEVQDDSSNVVFAIAAGAVQAASGTVKYYFSVGAPRETTVVNGYLSVNCPGELFLSGGYTLRFYDVNAVDAAADDMTVSFMAKKYVV